MNDLTVYLEKMSAFSRMLRREGLAVGPAETADAAQILSEIDLADRETMKMALMTVYAKSRAEQITFDRVFDGFFLSEEAMRAQVKEQLEEERRQELVKQEAEQNWEQNGGPSGLSEDQLDAYARMSEEERQRLTDIMEKYKQTKRHAPKLYSSFIKSVFAKSILEQQLKEEDAALGSISKDPEIGLYYRDISEFTDEEIPRATQLIRGLAAQINGEISSKKYRRGSSGKLDFRRTIRKGLESGGSFYHLSYKSKSHRKKTLVVLADISGSMIQFSEFALRLIQQLNQVSDNSKIFLFSEGVIEADAFSLQSMEAFRDTVRKSGLYGRGTDLGTALTYLIKKHPPLLTHSTTLLILSDAKTIDQPRAIQALDQAKRMAGQVIWLNPIPESKWKYLGSTRTFSQVTTMLSCSTLKELAAACRKLAVTARK